MTQFTRVVDGSTELRAALFNDLQEAIEQQSFNVMRYGAIGDGVTDDTAAIQAALDAAGAAGAGEFIGAVALVPPGIYGVTDTLVVPKNVTVEGSGSRVSVLKAITGFPTDGSAVIQLGAQAFDYEHGMTLRNLMVDCNEITGSIGVVSTTLQEPGGIYHCIINRYMGRGVYVYKDGTNVPSHFEMDGCELIAGNGGSGTGPSMELNEVANPSIIRRTTITTNGDNLQRDDPALKATDSPVIIEALNMERHDIGMDFYRGDGGNGMATVIGTLGSPTLEKTINLHTDFPIMVTALRSHASVAGIYHDDTDTVITRYDAPFYEHSSNKGLYIRTLTSAEDWSSQLGRHSEDVILMDCTAGNISMNAPWAPAHPGKVFTWKKTDSGGNYAGMAESYDSTGKIDGYAAKRITSQFGVVQMVSDGTSWHVLHQLGSITNV
jgi:hypothetical protein